MIRCVRGKAFQCHHRYRSVRLTPLGCSQETVRSKHSRPLLSTSTKKGSDTELASELRGIGVERLFDPASEIDFEDVVRPSLLRHIDCARAGASLQPLDLNNQRRWEAYDLHLSLVDFTHWAREQYDFILYDGPTKLSLTSDAALTASDYVSRGFWRNPHHPIPHPLLTTH